MRTAATLVLVGLAVAPLGAQRGGRYGNGAQGIPPGHLPPPGACRVWYDNRPPGHQPPPTSCREAERVAARDRQARVIYGSREQGDYGRWDRDGDRRDEGRAIPRDGRRSPNDRGRYGYTSVPFDNGYRDGYDKGREDARDRDAYDPARQGRYRSADHGYDRRYGSKEQYRDVYRDGFRAGYDEGYRDVVRYGPDRRDDSRRWFPWPF